jgi:hypothetical protein
MIPYQSNLRLLAKWNNNNNNNNNNTIREWRVSQQRVWRLWFWALSPHSLVVSFLSFFHSFSWSGVRLIPFGMWATIWPIVLTLDDGWWWVWSSRWNDSHEKLKCSEKTCPSTDLSTTNPLVTDQDSNPGRRVGKPVIYHMSYVTARVVCWVYTHVSEKHTASIFRVECSALNVEAARFSEMLLPVCRMSHLRRITN